MLMTCLACAIAQAGATAPIERPADAAPTTPASTARTLDRVTVQGTRLRGVGAFDTPASTATVDLAADPARVGADVSDALGSVPGLLARDRHNLAQDTQLSIRGFGSRATFGVRGVRLYVDGIPASMPDGQGQLSHFSLTGGDRIDVIRGPFSALHGNSSGGVVEMWSADGRAGDPWRIRASTGSHDSQLLATQLLGGTQRTGYNLALSRYDTDGWRDHSAARRDIANLKFHADLGARRRLDLVANWIDVDAQDPLGLTAEQARTDPRQAVAVAHQYDTRKTIRQQQIGAVYEHGLGDAQTVQLRAYGGGRDVVQFLPIPPAPQAGPLHAGGVIDLDNRYDGVDARWTWEGALAARPFEITLGTNLDRQRQTRRGWENFVGDRLGVRGALRRDERNTLENADGYAQAWWQFAPRWSLLAGVRHSEVTFESDDFYVTGANPDDSGRVRYRQTAPVAGVTFAPDEAVRVYASMGRGFETPTFNELSYRTDGGAGLAFDLQPATSDNLEIGLKWRGAAGWSLEAALFRADTDDELAVARNVGGRSSFRNVGQARRQGAEAAFATPLGEGWDLQLAWTWLDATFRSEYGICQAAGCTVPDTVVPAGTRIPGVAEQQLHARLRWRHADWSASLEGEALGDVAVNDLDSERAAGHALLHLAGSRDWRTRHGRLRAFARVDNVFDTRHIGSVIVNEGNGRFYEPGAERRYTVGLQWDWSRAPAPAG